MNKLRGQLSPYLHAHSDNPIDWFPWGEEAFSEAKSRNVPVLISIGYHTCHWCHVMARESFEDPEIGQLVNDSMVAIKVDREEHPDVDQLYLTQASAFIEQLGWPLTIFATPEGDTFHAATYLPPSPRGDTPSFRQVVTAVAEAWRAQPQQVRDSARALRDAIAEADAEGKKRAEKDPAALDWPAVFQHLASQEDPTNGGFGTAPKFPVAPVIRFLLSSGRPDSVALATRTLTAMAGGDLRDPVEGGFFRYSTKADWSEPHYERMLYDNAGLLWCYAQASMSEEAAGIVIFLRQQLRVPGGFASAQDSESVIDGQRVEGGYYLLTADQREAAEKPALDDKVLTGWNGLALWGLSRAARAGIPGEPLELAREVANELLTHHRQADGSIIRMSRGYTASAAAATLEDYGGLARGLIELGLISGDVECFVVAKSLVDQCMDPGHPHQFVAPGGGDALVSSMGAVVGDVSEGASPSGLALVADSALVIAQLTGDHSYREAAQSALAVYREAVAMRPLGFGGLATVLFQLDQPERELVVVSDDPHHPMAVFAKTLKRPGWIATSVTSDQASQLAEAGFGLFAERFGAHHAVAFVCEGGVCALPVDNLESLDELMSRTN